MTNFDELQGYRYARDTLLSTSPRMMPDVIRNLRDAADKHPASYAAGILKMLEKVSAK